MWQKIAMAILPRAVEELFTYVSNKVTGEPVRKKYDTAKLTQLEMDYLLTAFRVFKEERKFLNITTQEKLTKHLNKKFGVDKTYKTYYNYVRKANNANNNHK